MTKRTHKTIVTLCSIISFPSLMIGNFTRPFRWGFCIRTWKSYTMKDLISMRQMWFSPVSPTIKTGRNDRTEILLKVALNTITLITITPFTSSSQLTTSIHWSCYCTVHVFVIDFCDNIWSF